MKPMILILACVMTVGCGDNPSPVQPFPRPAMPIPIPVETAIVKAAVIDSTRLVILEVKAYGSAFMMRFNAGQIITLKVPGAANGDEGFAEIRSRLNLDGTESLYLGKWRSK